MIVFISIPWFSPAYKAGGPIQSIANLVNNYTSNIEYKIFCGNTDLNNEPLQNIEEDKWIKFNECTQVWFTSKSGAAKKLQSQVTLIKPNVIFIIGIFSWQYNLLPLLFCKATKKILSVRGMLHPGALSQKSAKKNIFLNLLKILKVQNNASFHATNSTEAVYIKNTFGNGAQVYIADNYPKNIQHTLPLCKNIGVLKIVSIAIISPMKNYLLVLQALANCKGSIEYNIFGSIKDTQYWELCKKQISMLPSNIRVHYHGDINPTKIENELAQNHIFILPSKSENFGHSLIEALAAGKPVITSYNTPWNNLLNCKAGINVNIDEVSISNAINIFTSMEAKMYNQFCEAALIYRQQNIDEAMLHFQYQQMFTV